MQDFQYQGFVNPYAASIADEIARSGDAHARAAEIVGQAQARAAAITGAGWGRAVENIGNLPTQLAVTANAQADRKLKEQELAMTVEQRQAVQAQRVAQLAGRLAGTSSSPEAFVAGVDQATTSGLLHPEIAAHLKAQVQAAGPDGFRDLRQRLVDFADQFTTPITLKEGESLVRPSVGGGAPVVANGPPKMIPLRPGDQLVPSDGGAAVASAPFAPGTGQHVVNGQVVDASGHAVGDAVPKQSTPEEIALAQARVKEIDAKLAGTIPMSQDEKAKLQLDREHLAAQITHWTNADNALDTAPTLTPEGLDLTAKNFAMTGQLPPMGNGKNGAAVRTSIINRGAQMYSGMDLATQRAAYDANKKSLDQIQANADAVNAFENTAKKNIDLFLEQARKVTDTGMPLLNTPARWTSGEVLGSEDQKAYDAARRIAVNEIAKVTGNPGLKGELSDAARKEVESFVPNNATLGQAIRVMNVLKQDMDNRQVSYADQIKAIMQRISTPPAGASSSSSASGAGRTVKMRAPNGQEQDVAADQVDHYKALGASVVP